MDEQFGISRGDVEAAEAETARKLAADRAVELESPALRTYVSQNPDADMTLLKFVDEMKTRFDLATQESKQQVDALREQIVQMRALNSASNIKDYIANGGSVSGLKAEVALGNVILDEANTDILTRGSYLWVSDSELHNNAYITQEVEWEIHI